MKSFKFYFMEAAGLKTYTTMARGQWFARPERFDIVRKMLKNNQPLTMADGTAVLFKGTDANLKSIDDFEKTESDGDKGPKTFELVADNGVVYQSNKIGKSEALGGRGKGGGASGKTKQGEALQCVYLAAMIGEGTDKEFPHFNQELLKSYYNKAEVDVGNASFDYIMEATDAWHYSGYTTAKYILKDMTVKETGKKLLNASTNYEFHRDSKKMNAIYTAKTAAAKAIGRSLNHDKWNPGDIWIMKKGFDPARELSKTDILQLNTQIKDLFTDQVLMGVSLKQIASLKDKATHSVWNWDGAVIDPVTYTGTYVKAQKLRNKTLFDNQSANFAFNFKGKQKTAALRTFTNFGSVTFEISGKGAQGVKAGWEQVQWAVNEYLSRSLPSFIGMKLKDSKSYQNNAKNCAKGDTRTLKPFYEAMKNSKLDTSELDKMSFDEFVEKAKTKPANWWHSKYISNAVAIAFANGSKIDCDKALTHIVNYAASNVDISSVYIKVEER